MEVDVRTEEIARKNDDFRINGTSIHFTCGVIETGNKWEILNEVRNFNDFSESNNPWGERDFGSFNVNGTKVFWKIDYYDPDCKYFMDPLDPKCNRVLTVMLADEY